MLAAYAVSIDAPDQLAGLVIGDHPEGVGSDLANLTGSGMTVERNLPPRGRGDRRHLGTIRLDGALWVESG